jgi:serine protease Do
VKAFLFVLLRGVLLVIAIGWLTYRTHHSGPALCELHSWWWQGTGRSDQAIAPAERSSGNDGSIDRYETEPHREGPKADAVDGQLGSVRELVQWIQQPLGGPSLLEGLMPSPTRYQKMHYNVLQAFKEAVGNQWMATVRVLSSGQPIAMGAIVRDDGFVVTKASELAGDLLECRLYDGTRVKASRRAVRSDLDLALLKIERTRLPVVDWTGSTVPVIGSWTASTDVRAMPMSIGVISVAPRPIQPERAVMGISFDWTGEGNLITKVLPGSGADQAGMLEGDLLLKIDGITLTSRQHLLERVASMKAGQWVEVEFQRSETVDQVRVRLMDLSSNLLDPAEMEVNGKVSARASGFPSVFQHDTVLSPNQCGGPLVDLEGKAVGLNIARAGRVCSYALPADIVLAAVDQMLREMPAGIAQEVLKPVIAP